MSAAATPDKLKDKSTQEFLAWLDQLQLDLDIVWKYTNDAWFCMVEDFDLTGTGATERDALRDALQLVSAYLADCFCDGMAPQDVYRPIPLALKLEVRRDLAIGAVFRLVGRARSTHQEKTVVLPEWITSSFTPASAYC